MGYKQKSIDYLNDSPAKVLISICLPLILVNVVLAFTSLLTNELYSNFVGERVFSVMGYLSAVTTSFSSIVSSIMFAAWIKIAHHFAFDDRSVTERQIFNGLAAIAVVEIALALLMILCADPVLRILSVPAEIYADAKLYYVLEILCYFPVPLAALFLTIVNGTSSASRLFWVNIMVVCTNAVVAVFALAVFRAGIVGVALMPMMGAVIQLTFYAVMFKKDGFRFDCRDALRHLDWKKIRSIIRYGFVIALQNLLCTSGYLIVTYQANRYLSLEYISVLNISLPLAGIISAVSSAGLAFFPPNYAAQKTDRMKRFFALSIACCFVYGIVCFILYALLGNWYYGRLFRDPEIIALGAEYWMWFGVGQLFLALLSPVKNFFDSVGMGTLSLLSGIGELVGNLICALLLIPQFGNIGRSLSYPLGYLFSAAFLIAAYVRSRNKIYLGKDRNA